MAVLKNGDKYRENANNTDNRYANISTITPTTTTTTATTTLSTSTWPRQHLNNNANNNNNNLNIDSRANISAETATTRTPTTTCKAAGKITNMKFCVFHTRVWLVAHVGKATFFRRVDEKLSC